MPVATNLRLPVAIETALRREAQRTGRSQQDIIREALGRHLHLEPGSGVGTDRDALVATGAVLPERSPYSELSAPVVLPTGMTSDDLLERDDRV